MRLVVEKLAAERGGRAVFADLSFVVEAGTLLRVSGANGAGKTTLLRILAGRRPESTRRRARRW